MTVHRVTVEQGGLKVGDTINARVDAEKRARTMANHTATHLLHAALREVLGPHVKQAGSLVAPDRLRFDFTHFAPLAQEEIAEIERLVNDQTLKNTRSRKRSRRWTRLWRAARWRSSARNIPTACAWSAYRIFD